MAGTILKRKALLVEWDSTRHPLETLDLRLGKRNCRVRGLRLEDGLSLEALGLEVGDEITHVASRKIGRFFQQVYFFFYFCCRSSCIVRLVIRSTLPKWTEMHSNGILDFPCQLSVGSATWFNRATAEVPVAHMPYSGGISNGLGNQGAGTHVAGNPSICFTHSVSLSLHGLSFFPSSTWLAGVEDTPQFALKRDAQVNDVSFMTWYKMLGLC